MVLSGFFYCIYGYRIRELLKASTSKDHETKAVTVTLFTKEILIYEKVTRLLFVLGCGIVFALPIIFLQIFLPFSNTKLYSIRI